MLELLSTPSANEASISPEKLPLQENPGFVGPANWAETCLVESLAVGFIPGAAERLHDPLPLPNHQLKEN